MEVVSVGRTKFVRSLALATFLTFSFVVAAAGFRILWLYQTRPGQPGDAPAHWPTASRLARPQSRPALLLFTHPGCSCTAATVSELANVMSRIQETQCPRPRILVVMVGAAPSREFHIPLLRSIRFSFPLAEIHFDALAAEAKMFRAKTSGQILLYDADGTLKFSGGITFSRGHVGSNRGGELLETAIRGSAEVLRFPVFGCALFSGASESL